MQFLSHPSHIACAQQTHLASGYSFELKRYRTFPPSQKVLLDNTELDFRVSTHFERVLI